MDWLTAKDWDDLWQIAISIAMMAVAIVGLNRWRTWRNNGVKKDNHFSIADGWFIVAVLSYSPLADIFERHGVPDFLALPIMFAIMTPGLLYQAHKVQMSQKAAQKNAILNPDATPKLEKVPLSAEEKRLAWKGHGLLILFAIVTIGPICWLAFSGIKLGSTGLVALFCFCLAVLALLMFGLVGRWPGSMRLEKSLDIAATPNQIWDALIYQEATPHHKKIIRRVEKLAEPGEVYLVHYFNNDLCTECALPCHPDAPGLTNRIAVRESSKPNLYAIRSWPKGGTGMMDNILEYEDSTYRIEGLPSGGSRISLVEEVFKPRMWIAIMLRLGDPLGESLRELKAHLDGQSSDNIYKTGADRIAATRHAPKFCGCAKAVPADALLA